jgi:MFS family permease
MRVAKAVGLRVEQSFSALRERDFRYLALSTVALGYGQWFQQIGLGWLVFEETGSALQMGAITAVRGVVVLLLSPFAGPVADRHNRRQLILWSTGATLAQALVLALLVAVGRLPIWGLYVFSIAEGAAAAVNQPARQAFVYDVAGRERLARAVPLNAMANQFARVSAPAVAGMVIGFAGTSVVFFLLAALKLLSMALTFMISRSSRQVFASRGPSALQTLREGLVYSLSNRAILGLLIITMVPTLLIYPYIQFLPFFAAKMGGGAQSYGVLATGVGWGSMVGLSALVLFGEVKRKGRLMLAAQGLYPAAVACFALTNSLPVAMGFLILAGVCNSINTSMQNTLFLLLAKEDMRGRVMSLYTMTSGLQPIGSLTLGAAIGAWGATTAVFSFMIAAISLVIMAAAGFGTVRKA